MLSQFFILSLKGDTLVFRDYREDVVKDTPEIFFRKLTVLDEDQTGPIFAFDGVYYIYIKRNGLFFVTTTKSDEIGPTYVVELLDRIATICKDYCGSLNEESVRCNFTLIYEILDEVLDYGYPQIMSTEELKPYIFHDVHIVSDAVKSKPQQLQSAVFGADMITLPSTASEVSVHASTKKGGRKNEVFVDVLEQLIVLYGPNGALIHSEINGTLQVKSFLAGNPEIRIGLNENLALEKQSAGGRKAIVLEEYSVHERVDKDVFQGCRQLKVSPPEGEFVAMRYQLTGEFIKPLPFCLHPYIDEAEDGKSIEVSVRLSCELPSANSATNILIRIPVPRATLSVSSDVTSGSKTAEFKPNKKAIYWGIKKMPGGKEHFAKFKINLPQAGRSARQEIGPISMEFEIPMYVCSGLNIRYLKVSERDNLYNPMRWIRLITHCDSFVQRL